MANNEKFFTADELIKRWRGRVSRGTLANWRAQGKGPRFTKLEGTVLYSRDEVEKFERKNLIKV
ncbi:MAG: DNA-binding protein [Candidatus Aminicenantes bacterium]|nr:DNA-binding protein [Candidatus Aminicenantes bacterium]NIQ69349.1 DNA-binding protein [Candidatus Aminicenantes bacterium]NIT25349.1 DNA-binding protein [Candidatus Aminicenantes bacterium]